MQDKVDNLGVLYENILITGIRRKKTRSRIFSKRKAPLDYEISGEPISHGSGQLLFFIRKVNHAKAQELQSVGFRFGTPCQVLPLLAEGLGVTIEQLSPCLERMRSHSNKSVLFEEGVHLAFFAARPLLHRGFDVLVLRHAKAMIPSVKLPVLKLEEWHRKFLKRLDNQGVADCFDIIYGNTDPIIKDENEKVFIRAFAEAMTNLAGQVGDGFFKKARFSAKVLLAPSATAEAPTIIAFRIIADAHQASILNEELMFASSRLFFAQQHAFKGSTDNDIFNKCARQDLLMHTRRSGVEFTASGPRLSTKSIMSSRRSSPIWPFARAHDISSITNLMEENSNPPVPYIQQTDEFRMDIQENVPTLSADMELTPSRSNSYGGSSVTEQNTFADELMLMTMRDYQI